MLHGDLGKVDVVQFLLHTSLNLYIHHRWATGFLELGPETSESPLPPHRTSLRQCICHKRAAYCIHLGLFPSEL